MLCVSRSVCHGYAVVIALPSMARQKPQIPATPYERQGFAIIYHRRSSVCLCHMLALPAKLREIDTDDIHTVK